MSIPGYKAQHASRFGNAVLHLAVVRLLSTNLWKAQLGSTSGPSEKLPWKSYFAVCSRPLGIPTLPQPAFVFAPFLSNIPMLPIKPIFYLCLEVLITTSKVKWQVLKGTDHILHYNVYPSSKLQPWADMAFLHTSQSLIRFQQP